MRLFDGRDAIEFERSESGVVVLLTGAQLRTASRDVLQHHVTVAEQCPDDYQAALLYPVRPGDRTVRASAERARTRVEKLRVAQQLSSLQTLAGRFRIPFLHPDNLTVTGAGVGVIHFGLEGVLAPMTFDEALYLRGYKALVLSVLQPRLSYEKLVDGALVLRDELSQRIQACETLTAVVSVVDAELAAEEARAARERVSVPKLRYRLLAGLGAVAVVAAGVLGWFAYSSYAVVQPRQEAIVAAHASFVTSDYARTLADLDGYSPSDLPKSARYVLAVSSIKLSELTGAQKEAVLNNISTKTDDNTLEYWIFLARGELERALNLAKNLGDDQLTLLAYTDLYQATKLDSKMDGGRKQKLLEEYSTEIEKLTASLGGEK